MKRLKITFCMPCREVSEWKNEKPMNLHIVNKTPRATVSKTPYNAEASPRTTFPQIYDGVRQYCWNILVVQ
jgi:hypothetical protein